MTSSHPTTIAELVAKAGRSGRGKSKRRGNKAYYKSLAEKRWKKTKETK